MTIFEREGLTIESNLNLFDILPYWNQITEKQQKLLRNSVREEFYRKGRLIHRGSQDCTGLVLVRKGQLRIFMISENGKEITLYRLFERDICLLSASCILNNIQFDVHIEAEKDTSTFLIPSGVYEQLMKESIPISNYTNQLISSRFSDVMWLMEQILFKNFDSRLASFLLEQQSIEGSNTLYITHEEIAKNLGSAREVVSRMLKYFQSEHMVSLFRGGITVENTEKIMALVERS